MGSLPQIPRISLTPDALVRGVAIPAPPRHFLSRLPATDWVAEKRRQASAKDGIVVDCGESFLVK